MFWIEKTYAEFLLAPFSPIFTWILELDLIFGTAIRIISTWKYTFPQIIWLVLYPCRNELPIGLAAFSHPFISSFILIFNSSTKFISCSKKRFTQFKMFLGSLLKIFFVANYCVFWVKYKIYNWFVQRYIYYRFWNGKYKDNKIISIQKLQCIYKISQLWSIYYIYWKQAKFK